jgi:hypothetical protein
VGGPSGSAPEATGYRILEVLAGYELNAVLQASGQLEPVTEIGTGGTEAGPDRGLQSDLLGRAFQVPASRRRQQSRRTDAVGRLQGNMIRLGHER